MKNGQLWFDAETLHSAQAEWSEPIKMNKKIQSIYCCWSIKSEIEKQKWFDQQWNGIGDNESQFPFEYFQVKKEYMEKATTSRWEVVKKFEILFS